MTGRSLRKAGDSSLTRRKSSRPSGRPTAKVNDRVEIWWDADETYYRGTLTEQFKSTSFRILYDDGETEDVELSAEEWRYAVDTSTQARDTIAHQNDDPDVVEVVLDGSDDTPPDHSRSPNLKSSAKEQHKPPQPLNPIPMDIDMPSLPNFPKKEAPLTSSIFPLVKDVVKQSNPLPVDSSLDPKKTKAIVLPVKQEMKHPTAASDSSKSASTKVRPKQKFARIRKDGTSAATSKSKPRRAPSNDPDTPAKSVSVAASLPAHPSQTLDATKVPTVSDSQGPGKQVLTTSDVELKKNTRVAMEMENIGPRKTPAAAKMEIDTVSEPFKPTGRAADIVKGRRSHYNQPPPPPKNTTATRTFDKLAANDAGVTGTPRPSVGLVTTKPTVTKNMSLKARPECTSQSRQPAASENRTPTAKSKLASVSAPHARSDGEDRGSVVEGASLLHRRSSNTPSLREVGARSGKGHLSQAQHKSVSKGSAKDAALTSDRGSSNTKLSRKEDLYRSRSSGEKPNTSAVADKKKKKKKSSSALKGSAMDRDATGRVREMEQRGLKTERLLVHPASSNPVARDAANTEMVSIGAGKKSGRVVDAEKKTGNPMPARLSLKEQAGTAGGVGSNTNNISSDSHGKNGNRAVCAADVTGASAIHAASRALSNGQLVTPSRDDRLTKKVGEQEHRAVVTGGAQGSAPVRQKRDRAEDANNLNAMKRARTQATGGSAPALPAHVEVNAHAQIAQGHPVGRHEIVGLGREIMSSVTDQMASVSRDVKSLVSMSLKFRQDAEFYKDVVHRSVVEEGASVRGALQDLRDELFAAIDDRARQTEYRIIQRVHEAFANYNGLEGVNGAGPAVHRNGPVLREAPATSRDFEGARGQMVSQPFPNGRGSNYTSPDGRLIGAIPERNARHALDENVNGHNESPTTIANVNQGSARDGPMRNATNHEAVKDNEDAIAMGALTARASHLVARQVTVWLLETPHEYNPGAGPVSVWAQRTAASTFEKVADKLKNFNSFMQAYQILCSSLGNDAVELQWFVSPGVQEHLRRARRNYAAWDPPPSDEEWTAEMCLLRELSERFDRAMQKYGRSDVTMIEACVEISQLAASDNSLGGYRTTNGGTN